jgi:hypothetical protein
MNERPIRVCIVEDDKPTRNGLVKLLRYAPDIVCLGALRTPHVKFHHFNRASY